MFFPLNSERLSTYSLLEGLLRSLHHPRVQRDVRELPKNLRHVHLRAHITVSQVFLGVGARLRNSRPLCWHGMVFPALRERVVWVACRGLLSRLFLNLFHCGFGLDWCRHFSEQVLPLQRVLLDMRKYVSFEYVALRSRRRN
jgi:hypothetical protein